MYRNEKGRTKPNNATTKYGTSEGEQRQKQYFHHSEHIVGNRMESEAAVAAAAAVVVVVVVEVVFATTWRFGGRSKGSGSGRPQCKIRPRNYCAIDRWRCEPLGILQLSIIYMRGFVLVFFLRIWLECVLVWLGITNHFSGVVQHTMTREGPMRSFP